MGWDPMGWVSVTWDPMGWVPITWDPMGWVMNSAWKVSKLSQNLELLPGPLIIEVAASTVAAVVD